MKCKTISELMRFLSIQEQALGDDSPEVAVTVSRIADMHMEGGNLDDAEKLYRRALEIREKAIGPHRKESEESRASLARIKALRAPSEPELEPDQPAFRGAWFSGVTSINSEVVEPFPLVSGEFDALAFQPVDSSTCLDAIPETMLLPHGQVREQERNLEEIKELQLESELIRQVSGDDSTLLAECLTKLADLLCRSKRYTEMEPHLIEALAIRERRLGPDHHLVSNSVKNLARLYYFQGKFAKARPLFERALLIRRKVFGTNSMKVGDVLTQYAKLLRKMNRYDEAAIMDREAASIKTKHQGWRRV
ncbi:MAG: tetratricopeptide repeat protein [Cyanobacteria bacterium HKST-UBA02]|nr:tetratricopeptide repeat protein [Cyanobacteria bacterium HKST-UBA02]